MRNTQLKEQLKELIDNMLDETIIELHNNYCIACNNYDDCIIPMWYLDDDLQDMAPTKIIDNCKDIDTNEMYYQWGVFGAVSFNDPWDYVFVGDIITHILDTLDDLENEDIKELLYKYEDEKED